MQIDSLEIGRSDLWRARADDGANSSQYSTAQFSVSARVARHAESCSPVNNEVQATRRPTLRINNATKNEAVGTVIYYFNVALDQALASSSRPAPLRGHTHPVRGHSRFQYSTTYYWRVYANDGDAGTGWSATAVFRRRPRRQAAVVVEVAAAVVVVEVAARAPLAA